MPYRVVRLTQFDDGWQSGIASGVIHPEVDEIRLQGLVRFLSLEPRHPSLQFVDGPDNYYRVALIDGPIRVEVWYEVVEDDFTVYLMNLEVYR